jgi:D-alanine-D-alanine ligase
VILYGGRSAEHEVSCVSAYHVARAVDRDRYDLRLVGITTHGAWVDATGSLGATDLPAQGSTRMLPSPDDLFDQGGGHGGFSPFSPLSELSRPGEASSQHDSAPSTTVDAVPAIDAGEEPVVVLPLLHGPMGEDGTVQGLLEVLGVPYCGPGVAGSAVAMDKGLAKTLLASAGIPQARFVLLREEDTDDDAATSVVSRVEAELGWPVFVKPANMGSSIGISKVAGPDELLPALAIAARFDEYFVVEEAVTGREIEMGVLGWPTLRTSVPGEVKPSHDFYDFEDKYLEGSALIEIPADLPEGIVEEMSRLAIEACRALRVDGMARVDFFYEEGGRGPLVNEINTIPGFTPISMYPQLWAASGVGYSELLDQLVDQALRRSARRSRFHTRRA